MYYEQKNYKENPHPLFIVHYLSRNILPNHPGSVKIKPSLKVRCFIRFWKKDQKNEMLQYLEGDILNMYEFLHDIYGDVDNQHFQLIYYNYGKDCEYK